MAGSLHPQEGARFLLEQLAVEQDGGAARYRGAVYTPEEAFEYEVEMRMGGEVVMAARPGGSAAPAELEDKLLAHARATARAAERKRREGLPPWPHRVLRWRGPGRG